MTDEYLLTFSQKDVTHHVTCMVNDAPVPGSRLLPVTGTYEASRKYVQRYPLQNSEPFGRPFAAVIVIESKLRRPVTELWSS
jgi:hypothetical protein